MRALELLKQLIVTMGRVDTDLLTVIMRDKIITTMLAIIKQYPFSNAAAQQCFTILETIIKSGKLNEKNQQDLKRFIFVELQGSSQFEY